jgi:predicted transcriptional regulator of viral defense system
MTKTQTEEILALAKNGFIKSSDVAKRKLPTVVLTRMVRQGQLSRVGRGLYILPGRHPTEHEYLIYLSYLCPRATVCLLSALRFHDLTTQAPHEVWIALAAGSREPRIELIPLHIVRFSGKALTFGIEKHTIEDQELKVTGVARTIADCFKFRNKIGLDVALEALREGWDSKRVTIDDIWKAATVCRVANVMRPYLESLP